MGTPSSSCSHKFEPRCLSRSRDAPHNFTLDTDLLLINRCADSKPFHKPLADAAHPRICWVLSFKSDLYSSSNVQNCFCASNLLNVVRDKTLTGKPITGSCEIRIEA